MENREETSNMSASEQDVPLVDKQSSEHEDTTSNQSNEYNTDLDQHQHQSPEYMQRKLYFLLEQLKTMHNELPE